MIEPGVFPGNVALVTAFEEELNHKEHREHKDLPEKIQKEVALALILLFGFVSLCSLWFIGSKQAPGVGMTL